MTARVACRAFAAWWRPRSAAACPRMRAERIPTQADTLHRGARSRTCSRALVGQKLTESWGQQVVVDQRPGAGGIIAADTVAKSAPGRVHAAAHDRRVYDQRDALPEAAVQPRARSRAGRAARVDLVPRGRQPVGAGEIDAGARPARAREAGAAQLRAFGARHDRASRLRDAEDERAHRDRAGVVQGHRAGDHRRDRAGSRSSCSRSCRAGCRTCRRASCARSR